MALSPFEAPYGQEARFYTLVASLILLALWGLVRLARDMAIVTQPFRRVTVARAIAMGSGRAGIRRFRLPDEIRRLCDSALELKLVALNPTIEAAPDIATQGNDTSQAFHCRRGSAPRRRRLRAAEISQTNS